MLLIFVEQSIPRCKREWYILYWSQESETLLSEDTTVKQPKRMRTFGRTFGNSD